MDIGFAHPLIWVIALLGAVVLPKTLLTATDWLIERCGEERLRGIPFSIWDPLYQNLLNLSRNLLFALKTSMPTQTFYIALNPERCMQQSLKTLLPYSDALTDQLILPHAPVLWPNLPFAIRGPIYRRVRTRFSPSVDHIFQNLNPALEENFDHQRFIDDQLRQQETGYRFIITEALHEHWFEVIGRARLFSIALTTTYLLIGTIWLQAALLPLLAWLPLVATLTILNRTSVLSKSAQQTLCKSLAYWLGERIYQIDHLVTGFSTGMSDLQRLKPLMAHALRPMLEDPALKTFTQTILGTTALVKVRAQLVDYILQNASIPFEHAQFRQERAKQLVVAFEKHLSQTNAVTFQQLLQPTFLLVQRLQLGIALLLCLALGLFLLLI